MPVALALLGRTGPCNRGYVGRIDIACPEMGPKLLGTPINPEWSFAALGSGAGHQGRVARRRTSRGEQTRALTPFSDALCWLDSALLAEKRGRRKLFLGGGLSHHVAFPFTTSNISVVVSRRSQIGEEGNARIYLQWVYEFLTYVGRRSGLQPRDEHINALLSLNLNSTDTPPQPRQRLSLKVDVV